ncbi:hypothetical protein HPB51_021772 [Rhipicephalus microplus]|uniref:Uncharacterized protein n=1 Tax=Rhipicephalus microplus TaxID=6941 RepID=A0A9J6DPP1_RHIMP|nr:hypothetical protein HPB51_021772 [Rhipicephalus microplus]
MDGKELFFIADPAHVLKNLRGQLLSSEVLTLSEATVAKHGLPSSQVNLEYVQAVLEEDSKRELKVAPNLSEMHTSAGHFTKMKVGVAVQLFREAPPAIRFLIKEGVLKQEAETTAWFMELISKWYALMSSRHPTLALSRRNCTRGRICPACASARADAGTGVSSPSPPRYSSERPNLCINVGNLLKRHRWSLLRYSGTFDKIHEIAKRNMKWVALYYDEVARWLKRDVAEFILDDQVLHGNGTLSGNDTRNEEDSDNLEVGDSDDFETRDIPEHGVSDGDIAERNSSYSQELREGPFNRGHNERVSKLSETTTGMNYGNESLVKRNADSREASANADNKGTSWSLNRSIEASYLEAAHIRNDVPNGANESDAPVPLAAEESSLNEIESTESYSQGYAKQSRESNATKSVMTSANVTSSAVSYQESATERMTRKNKLDNASFETVEQKQRPEDVYTDTTRTIQDFEHVFITKNYRDSPDGLEAGEPTMSSVNASLNTRNGGVTERAEIVFHGEYRDEGAAINERAREGTRMDKETAENVSKKVERMEISANSQDEDYSDTTVIIKDFEHLFITKHFRDSHDDLKAAEPAMPSVDDNDSQNTRNRGTAEGTVRYFASMFRDEGAAVNGGAGEDIRMAKATAVDLSKKADNVQISESSRNRSEGSDDNTMYARRSVARNVSARMKAADVPAVKFRAFFPEHLNEDAGNTVHYPDYTDTSVTITRFEDIFLTRHYIGSLGNSAPVDNVPASGKLSGNSDASVARKARRHVGAGNRDERVSQIKIKTP